MREAPKWKGSRQVIVKREKVSTYTTMRTLACGHQMVEPSGGKAKDARFALCRQCVKQPELKASVVTTLDPVD